MDDSINPLCTDDICLWPEPSTVGKEHDPVFFALTDYISSLSLMLGPSAH